MKKFKLTDLLIFVVTAELAGALSTLLAGDFTSFYSEIIRPPLSPPAWLFPVVWAILYALMGTSAYMIWNNRKNEIRRSTALRLYYTQLAVNFSWSIIFFRFRIFYFVNSFTILIGNRLAVFLRRRCGLHRDDLGLHHPQVRGVLQRLFHQRVVFLAVGLHALALHGRAFAQIEGA